MKIDDVKPDELIEIRQATICMIDICGFSKWCMDRVPSEIVTTMHMYNEFINNLVELHDGLTKIELVGDCCMILGGLDSSLDREICTNMTVSFAVKLLQQLNNVREIFDDNRIGIRIGINKSDVFGTLLTHPKRFQLYSKDINICSRLESTAIQNSIHISLKAIVSNKELIAHNHENTSLYVVGPLTCKEYKGVGLVSSYTFHIRKDEVLWFGTTMCSIREHMNTFSNLSNYTYIINDVESLFQKLYSFFWKAVIIVCSSESTMSVLISQLIAFREWERDREHQPIFVISELSTTSILQKQNLCTTISSINELRRIVMEQDLNAVRRREPRRSTL